MPNSSAGPKPQTKKRKATDTTPQANRAVKRARFQDARKILTQPPDKALGKNGELNVAAMVKAREFEIQAMNKNMRDSKHLLRQRAFQHVPNALRRRTASHNVKQIPKRLRARAAKEIRDDNTPTGKERFKKMMPRQRLRADLARAIGEKKLEKGTKESSRDGKGREKRKKGKTKGDKAKASKLGQKMVLKGKKDGVRQSETLEKSSSSGSLEKSQTGTRRTKERRLRRPIAKKNSLARPARPQARFRKRQINKSWLPTHLWHAKRAKMSDPKDPLWRFAIPQTPNEKCFRTTHRASTVRGCVAWDMSYMSTISLEGREASVLGALRSISVPESMLTACTGAKWRRGTRTWTGWIRERDRSWNSIAPVTMIWSPASEDITEQQTTNRKLLLRVHPSAFFQTWNELLKVCKMQRPQVSIEDLRFEIGSIEITGPGSTEALLAVLQPVSADSASTPTPTRTPTPTELAEEWQDIDTPAQTWQKLLALGNPAALPASALLAFNITDPRLRHPCVTLPRPSVDVKAQSDLLFLLSNWPVDETQSQADIFHRAARDKASRRLPSQKTINRRIADAGVGNTAPLPLSTDPSIPIMLYPSHVNRCSNSESRNMQAPWTVLLPWPCILAVWHKLMHYPLSTGSTPRFGGLVERMHLALERHEPYFPADYPATSAGWAWEGRQSEAVQKSWLGKPKGKRCEFESLRLHPEDGKGEHGAGWACDWGFLAVADRQAGFVEGTTPETRPSPKGMNKDDSAVNVLRESAHSPTNPASHVANGPRLPTTTTMLKTTTLEDFTILPDSPFHTLIGTSDKTCARRSPEDARASLQTIHLSPLDKGTIEPRARIYALPDAHVRPQAHKYWLQQAHDLPARHGKQAHKQSEHDETKRFATKTSASVLCAAKSETKAQLSVEVPAHITRAALAHTFLSPHKSHAMEQMPEDNIPLRSELVGFVTGGNYMLGKGATGGFGAVLGRWIRGDRRTRTRNSTTDATPKTAEPATAKHAFSNPAVLDEKEQGRKVATCTPQRKRSGLCLVRNAGERVPRLARWTAVD